MDSFTLCFALFAVSIFTALSFLVLGWLLAATVALTVGLFLFGIMTVLLILSL